MTSQWFIIRLSVLMLAGITEILVITTPEDQELVFSGCTRCHGSRHRYRVSAYVVQPSPDGLAQAFILG